MATLISNPLVWFWLYTIASSVSLVWWMTVGAYKQWLKYETELALTVAWQAHFKENVASGWIFYEGIGA